MKINKKEIEKHQKKYLEEWFKQREPYDPIICNPTTSPKEELDLLGNNNFEYSGGYIIIEDNQKGLKLCVEDIKVNKLFVDLYSLPNGKKVSNMLAHVSFSGVAMLDYEGYVLKKLRE